MFTKKELVCIKFGHINPPDSIYCQECGAELKRTSPPQADQEKSFFQNGLIQSGKVFFLLTIIVFLILSVIFTIWKIAQLTPPLTVSFTLRMGLTILAGEAVACPCATPGDLGGDRHACR